MHIRIRLGTKFQVKRQFFLPNLTKTRISGRKRKSRTCACVHGRYLLYQTFLHGGRQTQWYFNVSSPSSRGVPSKTCLFKVAFVEYQLKIIERSFSL